MAVETTQSLRMVELRAFATLTPSNPAAKLAFHEVVESTCLPQKCPHHQAFMYIKGKPEYVSDVAILSAGPDDLTHSDTPTEPDTDTEQERRQIGTIWVGCYVFNLTTTPMFPERGWLAGKGRSNEHVDLLLTIKDRVHGIRGKHALFAFSKETGFISVRRATNAVRLEVTVDGEPVNQTPFALNRHQARLRTGQLEYVFEYTRYAQSHDFYEKRDLLLKRIFNWTTQISSLTPTPAPHARTIGEWTLSSSLGKGGFGKVWAATNTRNELVAIKIVERNPSTASQIAQQIRVLRDIKALDTKGDLGRLVRLQDVIYQYGNEEYQGTIFEDVALIFAPATKGTLTQVVAQKGDISYSIMALFREALLGVDFLHSHGWVHRDLKPDNIGVEWEPPRAILLDLDGAIYVAPGKVVAPTPGIGGTIGYLAPERELYDYDSLVDVWSMGVIGYQLAYGEHPWKFSRNPWREGNHELRGPFEEKYSQAVAKMKTSMILGGSVNDLLTQMLRYTFANVNCGIRLSTRAALDHPCWDVVEERPEPPRKRAKAADTP